MDRESSIDWPKAWLDRAKAQGEEFGVIHFAATIAKNGLILMDVGGMNRKQLERLAAMIQAFAEKVDK